MCNLLLLQMLLYIIMYFVILVCMGKYFDSKHSFQSVSFSAKMKYFSLFASIDVLRMSIYFSARFSAHFTMSEKGQCVFVYVFLFNQLFFFCLFFFFFKRTHQGENHFWMHRITNFSHRLHLYI